MAESHRLFRSVFGYLPAHVVRAPAAVELLGAGVGQAHGLTVAAALDCGVEIACAPRPDGKCRILFAGQKQAAEFRPDQLHRDPSAPRADFPKAIMGVLQQRRVVLRGFDACVFDDIPVGSGLNRFAPTGLAMLLAMRALFPFKLHVPGSVAAQEGDSRRSVLSIDDRWSAIALCRTAEREFLRTDCSRTEHVAALFGRAWHVLLVDEAFRSCQALPLLGTVLVSCSPLRSIARPSTPQLAGIQARLSVAARKLGLKSLRTLDLAMLKANRHKLSDAEYAAARHLAVETAAAVAAERALLAGDIRQFGEFVTQSSHNEQELLSSTSEKDPALLEAGLSDPVCYGGRFVPWAGSGAVLYLVPHHQAEAFVSRLREDFNRRTGSDCPCRVFQITDGAA